MTRSLLALPLLALLPFAAAAQDNSALNYNYVEGGYVATDADLIDADGFGLRGSIAVHPNWHVFADYTRQSIDEVDLDTDQFRIGGGYNHAIGENTDLLARLAYERFDADVAGADAVNGYSAEVGVRSAFGDYVEGYVMAGYEDSKDFDGDFYGRLGAQVKFTDNWGVSGDVKVADGDTQWFIGPRFSW